MGQDDFSVRVCCGFFFLAVLQLFELCVFIMGAAHLDTEIDCTGNAGKLTVPMWLFVGGLVGFIFNGIFLCLYLSKFFLFKRVKSEHQEVGNLFCCCFFGLPAAILVILSVLFRIVWFIMGIILYLNLKQACKDNLTSLVNLGIFFFIAMMLSSCAKFAVASKKSPCY